MTINCGVDFNSRQQTICYCDSGGSEIRLAELDHERDDVGVFYAPLNRLSPVSAG